MLNCTTNNKNIRSHCNGNCEMINQMKTREKKTQPANGGMEYLEIFFSGIDTFVRVFIHHKRMHMEVSTLFWPNETLGMHTLIVLCNKSQMYEKDSSQHLKSSTVCNRMCMCVCFEKFETNFSPSSRLFWCVALSVSMFAF